MVGGLVHIVTPENGNRHRKTKKILRTVSIPLKWPFYNLLRSNAETIIENTVGHKGSCMLPVAARHTLPPTD